MIRFKRIVESAPNAIVLVNSNGEISYVNNKSEILFGYLKDELIGQKLEILIPEAFRNPHPQQMELFFKNPVTRLMGTGRDLFARRKDGTEIPVEIGLSPLETDEGNMILASVIDITQRKKQELIIKNQLAELELKNRELEQFSYVASHDLQEPLRTVSNYVEVLREDYSEKLDENALAYLGHIEDATKRMSSLINALLNFSILGKNNQPTIVDCKKVLNEVMADLHILIQTSQAIIQVGELPQIPGDETEIRQVFQNLISNAIKFRKKGVVPEINIQCKFNGNAYQFSVSDNGIGMAPDHQEKIFHIFQRLNNSDDYEGSGIGLANCKKIIELHGGKIWVESASGIGSTFYFNL